MSEELGGLVRRAQAGDRDAEDEVVRRMTGPVRAAVRRRLGPSLRRRVETDDLVQSVVATSMRQLGDFEYRGEAAFVGWLTTIAQRRVAGAADRHGAARRDVAREQRYTESAPAPSPRTAPPEAAMRAEAAQSLHEALAELPAEEQEIVRLHSWEGLSFREIAERLGLSDRFAAHRRFRKAMNRLVDLVDPHPAVGEDGTQEQDPAP